MKESNVELSVEKFIEFCELMGEEYIDHHTWSSCAVGKYLASVGIYLEDDRGSLSSLVSCSEDKYVVQGFERRLSNCYPYLENYLDNAVHDPTANTYVDIVEYYNLMYVK